MEKQAKHNVLSWLIYTICTYIVLLLTQQYIICIPISIIIGFLFSLLNSIIIQLRKLNGEKFPNIED